MTDIVYQDETVMLEEGETVLAALLRHGYEIPHSCRAGLCQSCLMRASEGTPPAQAQIGLKPTQIEQGYFLACRCEPSEPLRIALAGTEPHTTCTVVEKDTLGTDVLRLCLQAEKDYQYRAGQFLTLWGNGVGRSYSLASVPEVDNYLELHIRRIHGGKLSPWLFESAQVGDTLEIQGAKGECFYLSDDPDEPILLLGTGTGLAPLYGVVRDALWQGHEGEIHLIHGALRDEGLYLHQTLLQLAAEHDNLHYHARTLEPTDLEGAEAGNIETLALEIANTPAEWKFFLCGAPEMVEGMKKRLFLSGASMSNIFSDPFISANGA